MAGAKNSTQVASTAVTAAAMIPRGMLGALRRLQREQEPGRYIFTSERGAPMSAVAFRRMLPRLVPAAKMMPFGIHPYMLRHSTGFKLANQGVDRGPCVPALCCRLVDGGC